MTATTAKPTGPIPAAFAETMGDLRIAGRRAGDWAEAGRRSSSTTRRSSQARPRGSGRPFLA